MGTFTRASGGVHEKRLLLGFISPSLSSIGREEHNIRSECNVKSII